MNSVRPGPLNLQAVPTLTEVIELPAFVRSGDAPRPMPMPIAQAASAVAQESVAAFPVIDEEHLVQRVLTDLQRNAESEISLDLSAFVCYDPCVSSADRMLLLIFVSGASR